MANKLVLKRSSVAAKVPLASDLEAGELAVNLADAKLYTKDGSGNVILVGSGASGGAVSSVAGKTGAVTLVKGDVGLANVDNTSDASKPVSTAQQTALDLKSNLASPSFTGTPVAPTAAVNTNTTQIATTAFVNAEIANDATPISHVGTGGTQHAAATTSVAGFMSAADKTKLDGVASGATANTGTVTGVTATAPVVSSGGTAPVISITAATTSAAGSMSAADKTKLDGIAAGATANTGTVTGVTGTAPIVSSGGTAPAISISAATTGAAGSMSAADKSKLDGIAAGAQVNAVTSVAGRTGAVTLAVADVSGAQPSATAITTSNIGSQTVDRANFATNTTFSADSTGAGSIASRIETGFYENSAPTTAGGWPVTGSWHHLIASTHSNDSNYYSMQLAASFFANELYVRSTNGGGTTAWSKALLDNNFNSYAPTLTGTGASGTWGINISGNAATASNGGVTSVNGQTGAVTVTGAVAGGAIYENSQAITANYTITSGKNALSAGPITINSGITVTVPSGSTWVVA